MYTSNAHITIPGEPVAQARMKYRKLGNFVQVYDPKEKDKKRIREFLLTKKDSQTFSYPRISFRFYMPIPSSIRKKDHDLYHSGCYKHDKKPDVDNLIKLYLDCLDGIIIDKDQKVSLGPCVKVYGSEPRTEIWITETTSMLQQVELDPCVYVESAIPTSCETPCPSGS